MDETVTAQHLSIAWQRQVKTLSVTTAREGLFPQRPE
jgi:hypothetical protein